MVNNDLASDRTFLANHMRLFFACAAYVLHHALCAEVLVMFKIAVRVVQHKDRIRLHLPTFCPFKDLLHRLAEILYLARPPETPSLFSIAHF